MTQRLAIVGAGGHGREAFAVAHAAATAGAPWRTISLYDDGAVDRDRLQRIGAPLAGSIDDLISDPAPFVIAVGNPHARRRIADRIAASATAVELIDPSSSIGPDVELSEGVMMYPSVTITTNVRVGRHTHVNVGAVISHDCRLGDFVSVSPGVLLNGEVTIADDVFLGTGAIVLPGVTVGQGAVVGAGAVVASDVDPGATVVGVPAR